MSDYTPSTADVRESWHDAMFPNASDAAFGRWLASVKADAFDRGAKAQADGYGMQVDTINPYREDITA